MAREARYTAQLPPTKGTETQRRKVEEESSRRRVSLGQVIRESLDDRYDLNDGESSRSVAVRE